MPADSCPSGDDAQSTNMETGLWDLFMPKLHSPKHAELGPAVQCWREEKLLKSKSSLEKMTPWSSGGQLPTPESTRQNVSLPPCTSSLVPSLLHLQCLLACRNWRCRRPGNEARKISIGNPLDCHDMHASQPS